MSFIIGLPDGNKYIIKVRKYTTFISQQIIKQLIFKRRCHKNKRDRLEGETPRSSLFLNPNKLFIPSNY